MDCRDAIARVKCVGREDSIGDGFEESIPHQPTAATRSAHASVEDVPSYQWRTPLQRAVQVLKRHRDVMFHAAPGLAPISMIITNLAGHAYEGEHDLGEAILGIVERMGHYVRADVPRAAADLEENFWR